MSINLALIFLVFFASSTLAGPLRTAKQDIFHSTTLNEDEDVMTRIKNVNEESDVIVFEADIRLDENFPENDDPRVKRNAQRSRKYLWADKKIPYKISQELVDRWYTPTIFKAFEQFHSHTCLQFVPHTNQSNWINFINSNGCWSSVGQRYWQDGGQSLSLGSGCNITATVMHELLHALGFWHEQSRPDRNQFVEILWENIEKGKEHNFQKYGHYTVDNQGKPYDLQSIMHYGNTFFSANGQPTIQSITQKDLKLGQRVGFTQLDIDEINILYDCDGELSSWSTWSSFAPCDGHCNKRRERFCSSSNPSQDCPEADEYGVHDEVAVCSAEECYAPVAGHWGRWSSWSSCSMSCGPGTKSRSRACDDPAPAHNGSACVGDATDETTCLSQSCGLGPTDCEFEVDAKGLCTWVQDTTDERDWTRHEGTTASSRTGPMGDHTSGSGHYLYFESSHPVQPGDKARLLSQTFPGSNSSVCLVLSFHMYGVGIGSLIIYIRNETGTHLLVSKAGDHGESWHKMYIDVQSTSSYQVIIEAIRGSDFRSDIAIDDIYFVQGSCSAYPRRNLGCYQDNSRPLGDLYQNLRDDIDWYDMKKTVTACAKAAKERGYNVFGVEFYGECWSSHKAKQIYNKDGASNKCSHGVGEHWAFQAYEIL